MPLDAAQGRPPSQHPGPPPPLPGLPLHMRFALEITSVHRIRPTPEGRTRASRTCLLRHRHPAPNDGVEVKDLRPLTRSALAGQSLTPPPQPELSKRRGARAKREKTRV